MDESINNVKLWGECDDYNSSQSNSNTETMSNAAHEVILNSIQNSNLKKYFFNPEKQSNFIPIKKEVECIEINNTMKDVVKMLKYRDEIKDIVDKLKLKSDIDQLSDQLRSLPVPKLLSKSDLFTCKQFPIHYDSNFMNGVWDEKPLNITTESALNTLSSSITTILAFTGFTETTILPLQILTEISEEYIMKMLKLLKFNVEKEKLAGESGFCDVVDRTFHEMGIGSLKNLVIHYQNTIIDYKNKKLKEVEDELRSCEKTIEKMKEEQRQMKGHSIIMEDEHSGIPELHVTSILGNELLSNSFETGLQMLHTIENEQVTDVDNNSLMDVDSQNEFNDAKSVKRKRK